MRERNHHEATPREIERLRLQLAKWREGRRSPGRRRIPEEVWAHVGEAARRYGIWKTAKTLGLDHNKVKSMAQSHRGGPPVATFVELVAPQSGDCISECALEVESGRGSRLRIAVKGVTPSGLSTIIRDFAG